MITMNRKQLLAIFRYLKVPCDTYDLGTSMRIEACYDVEYTEQGWEVFFAVNGEKCDVAVFDSETDACLDLLYKVMHR